MVGDFYGMVRRNEVGYQAALDLEFSLPAH